MLFRCVIIDAISIFVCFALLCVCMSSYCVITWFVLLCLLNVLIVCCVVVHVCGDALVVRMSI